MASRSAFYVWQKSGLLLLTLSLALLTLSAVIPYRADGPSMIAHRGGAGYAPENTMAAFQLAERMGADFIELDVRLSKDRELVVIHDKTVDRTTSFIGNVSQYTLKELRSMDAGSYYSSEFSEERILSLQEVLDRFADRIGILIEIKDPPIYPGIEEKLAEILLRYNHDRIIIQSFDSQSLRHIHDLLPDIPVGVLIHEDQHPLSEVKLNQIAEYASYINYNHVLLDESFVRNIHDHNMKVMAWTLRYDRDMKRMKTIGVDGIITDYLS